MSKYSEHWAERAYKGARSYTQVNRRLVPQEFGMRLFRRATLARIERHLPPGPLELAVDLGCGVGDWAASYTRWADRVAAIDVSKAFIDEAGRRHSDLIASGALSFTRGDLLTFEDLEGAGLVGLGACVMYLSDEELDALASRLADAQPAGSLLYVRASVADPAGDRFETEGGAYRLKSHYDRLWKKLGYRSLFEEHSATIVASYVAGATHPGISARLAAVAEPAARAALWRFSEDTAYFNWLLRR